MEMTSSTIAVRAHDDATEGETQSAAQRALQGGVILNEVIKHMDVVTLTICKRVNIAFHATAMGKHLHVKLFLIPEVKSSVWTINHDDRTITHKRQATGPVTFNFSANLRNMNEYATGIEDMFPAKINDALLPDADAGAEMHAMLFKQVFHTQYSPVHSNFMLKFSPLGLHSEASCMRMFLSQPPLRVVRPNWVLLCEGPPDRGRHAFHNFECKKLTASVMAQWRLIGLDGKPFVLEDDESKEYHTYQAPEIINNRAGVRFQDLYYSLQGVIEEQQVQGRNVLALIVQVPLLGSEAQDRKVLRHEGTNIGMHGLFPTREEWANVEASMICQGPWFDPEDIDWDEIKLWKGQSLGVLYPLKEADEEEAEAVHE